MQGKEPKAVIKVDSINASFQPAKIGHLNGLQITYLKDYSTRNIFLYHDSGKVPTLPASIMCICVFVIQDMCVCMRERERERDLPICMCEDLCFTSLSFNKSLIILPLLCHCIFSCSFICVFPLTGFS